MDFIEIGNVKASRFILGGNPFSGFSHQTPETDREMMQYYSTARIKQTLEQAASAGVNTVLARTDWHIMRMLLEYWDDGGTLQWFAQTCPSVGDSGRWIDRAAAWGAKACHIHGGLMDYMLAQGTIGEAADYVARIRDHGMPAGIAGHNPKVFEWSEEHLDVDYYMCSYYNAAHRDKRAEHVSGMKEWFHDKDRRIMTRLIQSLSKPVIHYKIMAAGRNDPADAFDVAARSMRATDAVCVGVYTRDHPDMIRQDVDLFLSAVNARGSRPIEDSVQ